MNHWRVNCRWSPSTFRKMKPSRLIKGFEADPVLDIDGRLPQGQDDVGLARGVEFKVLRLSWLNHPVLVVFNHHKVLKGGKVDSIGLVLHGLLVVDLRDELALLHISVKVKRVVPILGLN